MKAELVENLKGESRIILTPETDSERAFLDDGEIDLESIVSGYTCEDEGLTERAVLVSVTFRAKKEIGQ